MRQFDHSDTLLLIEEQPDHLQALRDVCPGARILQLAVADADQAPDLVSRENVCLVVCELASDDSSVLSCLQKIRHVHPQLPLMATIPQRDFDLVLNAMRQGVDDVLPLPLEQTESFEAVQRIFARRKAQVDLVQTQKTAERSLDELVLLKAISETTGREENLQKLLERIVTSIETALDVEIVSLMLANDEQVLEIQASKGLPDNVRGTVKIPAGEGISGHVLQSGEPVLINDMATDGRFAPRDGVARYRTGSLLSVPVRYQDRVLGVLNVNNKRSGEGFSGADQDLLATIGHQTALAIENLKLVSSLQQKSRELEVAHRDLLMFHQGRTRFVCNLSHELKTPLTSVLGFADLLLNFSEHVDKNQLHEYLERIHTEAISLEKLLNGMLRLFSIDSGSENWDWQEIGLGELIDEVLRDHQSAIFEMDIEFDFSLPEELQPLWGDHDKLFLLLESLIDNAIKFNRIGGRISFVAENRLENNMEMVYLGIANEGHSVPMEHAEDIFFDYAQLGDLNTEKPPGVGIGLATCRAILRQMHGVIALEAYPGDGTRFGVLLPTRKAYEELSHDKEQY